MEDNNFVPQDSDPNDYKRPLPEEYGLEKFGEVQGFFRLVFFDNGPVLQVHGSSELITAAFTKLFITVPEVRRAIQQAVLLTGVSSIMGENVIKAHDLEASIEYIQTAKNQKEKNEKHKARRN